MSTVRDILHTEERRSLLITALSEYINKCRRLADRPTQGFGGLDEQIKKDAWREKQAECEDILNDLVREMD